MKWIAIKDQLPPVFAVALILFSLNVEARDRQQAIAFKRLYACPATGKHYGPCKNWIIDHRQALAVGGPDEPSNMRWMTFDDALAKDKWERRRGWQRRLERCSTDAATMIQTCD